MLLFVLYALYTMSMYTFREYRVNVAVNILEKKLSFFNVRALNARWNELLGVSSAFVVPIFFYFGCVVYIFLLFSSHCSSIRFGSSEVVFCFVCFSAKKKLSLYRYRWFWVVSLCVVDHKMSTNLVASTNSSSNLKFVVVLSVRAKKNNDSNSNGFTSSNVCFSPLMTIDIPNTMPIFDSTNNCYMLWFFSIQ